MKIVFYTKALIICENVPQFLKLTIKQLKIGLSNVRFGYGLINFNTNFLFYLDGDLGAYADAEKALMKQKHRLIWERRHGPVGTGMKE